MHMMGAISPDKFLYTLDVAINEVFCANVVEAVEPDLRVFNYDTVNTFHEHTHVPSQKLTNLINAVISDSWIAFFTGITIILLLCGSSTYIYVIRKRKLALNTVGIESDLYPHEATHARVVTGDVLDA